jgi:hypothetical protein
MDPLDVCTGRKWALSKAVPHRPVAYSLRACDSPSPKPTWCLESHAMQDDRCVNNRHSELRFNRHSVFACHGAPGVGSDDQDGLEHANMTVRMRRSVRLAT